VRVIYDERRNTNPFFLLAGLAWGGMFAVSLIAYLENALAASPEQRMVPEKSAEVWAAGWWAAGLAGGICLILGLLLRAAVTRIATDPQGIKMLRSWGGDRLCFEWADVRSWRVESYEEASYDTDGQGGMVTRTRLVVELKSTEIAVVMEHAWHTAVITELRAVVPTRQKQDAEPGAAAAAS
jgi:hypothetical protein